MNPILEAALFYERMGLSVIQLKPNSKEPLRAWQEFQRRRATAPEIQKWFQDFPNANLGIVTGAVSGIAVVDLDGTIGQENGI